MQTQQEHSEIVGLRRGASGPNAEFNSGVRDP